MAVRRVAEILTAVSMTMGRGAAARALADLADVGSADSLIDVGCGPGTAVREAARRGARSTGVDPSPDMLRLGRWITAARRGHNVTFVEGAAEALPLPDGGATVVWALSSLHHWADRAAGLSEARRVLPPGGRILLAERLVAVGARGHAAHGLTADGVEELERDLRDAGFASVRSATRVTGRRTLTIVQAVATTPALAPTAGSDPPRLT